MKIIPPPSWLFWAIIITSLIIVAMNWPSRAQETPDEWWHLTVDLHAQMHRINNEPDRRFLRSMINKLAVDTDAIPTLGEQFWLLSIRDELKKRK